MSKILIKTGFYSDFAKDVFNDVQRYVQENCAAVNYGFKNLLISKACKFQHFDDGEVVLREGPQMHHYARNSTLLNARISLALQLKELVFDKCDEREWKRYDFDTKITFYEKTYPVGGLYFIYDFLLNHRQSINVFKRMHPTAAAEILGTPTNPIASEVNTAIRQKVDMVWNEFNEAASNLNCCFPAIYSDTPAEVEFKARIKPIIDEFKIELDTRRKALENYVMRNLQKLKNLSECKFPILTDFDKI